MPISDSKTKLVSNYSQDPGLGIGWAYMVPRVLYEKYVLSWANDDDVCTYLFNVIVTESIPRLVLTCVGFQALIKAEQFVAGLRTTGINLAACGRSEMILPIGVGNLQKGERYGPLDPSQ